MNFEVEDWDKWHAAFLELILTKDERSINDIKGACWT